MLHWFSEDRHAALAGSRMLHNRLKHERLPLWQSLGKVIDGWATTGWDNGVDNTPAIKAAIDLFRGTAQMTFVPCLLSALGDALIRMNSYDYALEVAEEGLSLVEATEERNREVELLRIKGVASLGHEPNAFDKSINQLEKALIVAQSQHAKSMELKVAVDLALIWHKLGETTAAMSLLTPSYEFFAEGSSTPYVTRAKLVLEHLRQA